MADIAELIVALKLRDGLSSGLGRLNGQLRNMEGGLSQVGRGTGQVAGGIARIGTVAGVAAAGGLTAVITTAASFEQAWAGVTKTVEGANDDLLNDFKQLSREIPLSFEELAAIGAEGGALGIATEDLIDFTDVVARLAVSTDLTADQASTALGQLGNILHLSAEDMRDFGDSLVALGNDGASTESQILDMAARFGAAGKAAGLTNEEILALSSTTASMGIEAEAGGGALSRIFQNLTLDMANATDEGKLLADTMGISLAELRTRWDSDAGGVFEELLGHLNELDQFEAATFLSDLGITNTRDINAIRNLSSGVGEYQDQLATAEGQTNELNKESDAFFNTTAGKWETLKNNVRLAADEIGAELLPVVNEVADEFVDWLGDPAVQEGIKDFATDLAGGVRDLVREVKGADFGPLIDTMKGAATIAQAGFNAFNALPSGVKSLALAAFGINKLTGGALSDIARGFGNIFAGGLKLVFERGASPANPMWVQQVGGPGGVGGAAGRGGGLIGGLKTGAALASPLLIGAAAVEVINFQDMRAKATASLEGKLDNLDRSNIVQTERSIERINEQINMERPFLEGILFNTNVKPILEEELTELKQTKSAQERSEGLLRDAIPWHQRNVEAVNEMNASEGRRFAHLGAKSDAQKAAIQAFNQSEGTRFATLNGLARSANSYNARTASAAEITSRKRFDPKITTVNNITVPVNVAVNASVVANRIHQIRTTTSSGGFI